MGLQTIAAIFFVGDVVTDYFDETTSIWNRPHLMLEALANVGLIGGLVVEALFLTHILRRHARAERALSVASGALQDVMEEYFSEWHLTPAEADVANFTIKGCSIAEIATLRGSAEGTVKTHLNSIYRKAGVSGRSQLVNLLVEELFHAPPAGDLALPRTAAS
ncbi:helix-turn-helix transcriptional regulator [Albidovulum aquaemixtae]|nr:LuxR C-terminal-related transcriptional regulator [Defluviimonas aquaemixtae]